ncbi:MAG TPA: TetR/AcrR family transcriptional regulator [Chloroflexota bacterium]|jgi:AcrR family transcriptional regulator|nr:TetR/AcrR family transcriptional regulator [Chloroflexota bacterium]
MSKGDETRQAILDEATRVASRVGLQGLTIGALAAQTRLSKSGLFAHFRSKEALQVQVLEHAAAMFVDGVLRPALAAPRGEPRVRELFERWLAWCGGTWPGGDLFVAAAAELDDEPGPVRERLVRAQRDWLETIANVFRTGITEGQFRADADPEQFAHDLYGVVLAYHHARRLLRDPAAERRARLALDRLLDDARPPRH